MLSIEAMIHGYHIYRTCTRNQGCSTWRTLSDELSYCREYINWQEVTLLSLAQLVGCQGIELQTCLGVCMDVWISSKCNTQVWRPYSSVLNFWEEESHNL